MSVGKERERMDVQNVTVTKGRRRGRPRGLSEQRELFASCLDGLCNVGERRLLDVDDGRDGLGCMGCGGSVDEEGWDYSV